MVQIGGLGTIDLTFMSRIFVDRRAFKKYKTIPLIKRARLSVKIKYGDEQWWEKCF